MDSYPDSQVLNPQILHSGDPIGRCISDPDSSGQILRDFFSHVEVVMRGKNASFVMDELVLRNKDYTAMARCGGTSKTRTRWRGQVEVASFSTHSGPYMMQLHLDSSEYVNIFGFMVHATTRSWMWRNVFKIMRYVLLAAISHPIQLLGGRVKRWW